jgi:hypothetical protein
MTVTNSGGEKGGKAMSEDRKQILEMLAAGKINVNEAERLMAALEPGNGSARPGASGESGSKDPKARAKYLRVLVEAAGSTTGKAATVNVRVPMQLLRAGVRLASLIPQQAHNNLDQALSSHGVPLTLSQIKPENLEELIEHLDDLKVDVDGKDGNAMKVRVFCE